MTDPTPTERECTDVRCRRIDGRCVGYHCAHCGQPSSMLGHLECQEAARNEPQLGRGATNPASSALGQGDTAENPPTGLTATELVREVAIAWRRADCEEIAKTAGRTGVPWYRLPKHTKRWYLRKSKTALAMAMQRLSQRPEPWGRYELADLADQLANTTHQENPR